MKRFLCNLLPFILTLILLPGFLHGQQRPPAGGLFETTRTTEQFLSIRSIDRLSPDSAIITIPFGSRDGIFLGAEGNILTSRNTDDEEVKKLKRESNIYVASTVITRVGDSTATATVHLYKKYRDIRIVPNDILVIRTYAPRNKPGGGIFHELAKLNILFLDNARSEIAGQRELMQMTDPQLEQLLLNRYTQEIRDFYSDLSGYTDSTFITKYRSGPYQGLNMKEVFKNASIYDLRAYFQFVIKYPGKYIGGRWKINETFATWLLNLAPTGEQAWEWMVPEITRLSGKELTDFIVRYRFFIEADTLAKWDEQVRSLQEQGREPEAAALCDRLILTAQVLKDRDAEHAFYYTRSQLADGRGESQEALRDAIRAYRHQPANDNYAYQLANLYGKLERFDSCFLLYKDLLKKFPANTSIAGNYGWYKITAGQVEEAIPYCRSAYLENPGSVAYTVNYGHTFLLRGQPDSAKYYYTRTLRNLDLPADFLQGPKTDFDLFFKKGWQRQHVAEMADWMDREFQETYLPITRGNDVFRQARKKFEEQRYAEALQLFRQYINLVAGLREPRHLQVHNMQVWIGLCHSKLKQTDSAYLYYETAVRMAKEHLTPLRTEATRTDEDPLVSDLERLYDLSVASGRSRQAEQYRMLLDAETEKVMELSATPALHLITLAGSGGPSQTAAARLFHDRFSELKRSKTEGLIHYLSGSGTTRDQLDSLLESVRKRSKPEDILIFYYSGMISGEGNEGLLRFRESDTARGQLRLTDFLNRLDGIYARKKMLITDQPSPGLLGLIASRYVNLGRNSPELIYLSPGTITPLMPAGISLFTYQLTETLSELRKNDGFSAKDFVDKASYTLGRGQYYFPVLSFSFGKDFLLAENKKPVKVTVADPGADALRGVVVTNTADKQGQQASGPQRNHAVLVATDEYNDPGFKRLANPIYDAVTLGNLLREDFGFEVTLLKNPTLEELETTLGQFRDEKNYGPNDQLFLFFAGHGVYDERSKMGYLVAKDSREKDPNYKSYLSYSDLGNKYLKNIGCNRIFLVLDACFAGTFFESFGTRGSTDEANARMLESLKRRATNLHFYKGMSSGAKQYVEDGKSGQHSPFASALLTTLWTKGLSKNFVTADEIIADIKSKPPGNTDICEGRFQYSDPFSHFIFEMKNSGKESNIRTMNLK